MSAALFEISPEGVKTYEPRIEFVKDVNEVGGISLYHLVKHLYSASVKKDCQIKARTIDPLDSVSGTWYYTEIGLYHGRMSIPMHRVMVSENADREEIHLSYSGSELSSKPDVHHYRDLHEAVANIGFFFVKGRRRSDEETLAGTLLSQACDL